MIIKVSGNAHLWDWQLFKEKIKGDIINYNVEGGIIKSITYNCISLPEKSLLDKFNFTYKIL